MFAVHSRFIVTCRHVYIRPVEDVKSYGTCCGGRREFCLRHVEDVESSV